VPWDRFARFKLGHTRQAWHSSTGVKVQTSLELRALKSFTADSLLSRQLWRGTTAVIYGAMESAPISCTNSSNFVVRTRIGESGSDGYRLGIYRSNSEVVVHLSRGSFSARYTDLVGSNYQGNVHSAALSAISDVDFATRPIHFSVATSWHTPRDAIPSLLHHDVQYRETGTHSLCQTFSPHPAVFNLACKSKTPIQDMS